MSQKGIALGLDRKARAWHELKATRLGIALGGLIIIAIVSMMVLAGTTGTSADSVSATANIEADAARWTALGEFYTASLSSAERSSAASTARWEALGQQYQVGSFDVARGQAANAARYRAMAQLYLERHQAAIEAQTARYQTMAEWYGR